MALAVFNIRTASSSDLRALNKHCLERVEDGWSNIDPRRSKLNQVLYGNTGGVSASIDEWYRRTGSKKPTNQAETPFFTLVLSASKSNFVDGHDRFVKDAMDWLKKEAGDDLVFAELHLDETTPHIHAVVFPTYMKKSRKPGRIRKDESPEEFEARCRAAEQKPGVRVVGRSYHAWSRENSFDELRKSYSEATDLGYGNKLVNRDAKTTRAWVKEKVRKIRSAFEYFKGKDSKLDELFSEVFRLHSRTKRLNDALDASFQKLKSALPVQAMKPETRRRVDAVFSEIETVLSKHRTEIRTLSNELKVLHDEIPDMQPSMKR